MRTQRNRERREAPPARSKKPRVASTRLGLGVFAGKKYDPDAIIGEIEGQVIDDPDYHSVYCMDMGDSRCLEPSAPFRYVNHSCEPNCSFQWFDLSSSREAAPRRRVFLLAIVDITQQGPSLRNTLSGEYQSPWPH